MAHALTPSPGGAGLGLWPQRGKPSGLPLMPGLLLAVIVLLAHFGVMKTVGDELAQMHNPPQQPERVQVRYVREMALTPTTTLATRPPVAPRATRNTGAPLPRRPAQTSAPVVPDVVEDVVPAATHEPSPEAVAQAASSAASAASSAPVEAAIPPTAAAVEQVVDAVWPQTTRVSYTAHGYHRGEVHGSATVEWIRLEGDRYRMHMDVRAGAGAFRWSTSSSGRITEQGVRPERFEQTRGFLFSNKHLAVILGDQHIEFANGQQAARPADVQDINSQFVQLTYLFTTRQELTAPGQQVAFPLAFERGLRSYAYQVKGHEVLQTPLGAITTVHAVPQRLQAKDKDLVAQAWFAPQLHYLPIRIHITQGDETFIELNINKAPELAR